MSYSRRTDRQRSGKDSPGKRAAGEEAAVPREHGEAQRAGGTCSPPSLVVGRPQRVSLMVGTGHL